MKKMVFFVIPLIMTIMGCASSEQAAVQRTLSLAAPTAQPASPAVPKIYKAGDIGLVGSVIFYINPQNGKVAGISLQTGSMPDSSSYLLPILRSPTRLSENPTCPLGQTKRLPRNIAKNLI